MVSNSVVRKPAEGKAGDVLDTSLERDTFCPRCGEPGFLTERECWNASVPHATHHSYYFFGHTNSGKRTWCYLGKGPETRWWTKADREKVSKQVSNSEGG